MPDNRLPKQISYMGNCVWEGVPRGGLERETNTRRGTLWTIVAFPEKIGTPLRRTVLPGGAMYALVMLLMKQPE